MRMPTLEQTQRLLWRLITAPSGVADGLRALDDTDRLSRDGLEAIVNGDVVLPAVRRLDIYANMYFFRLLDALKEDYRAVLATVGDASFRNLITDYLLHHPPSHPSLRYAGKHLPPFLRSHPLAQAQPFLPNLAAFEWALVDAFDAPNADCITRDTLAAVAPGAWPKLRLQLAPSLQLLELDFAVGESWQRVQAGQPGGEPTRRANWVRIWRRELRVLLREIAADEFAGLQAAAAGESFATICERVAEHERSEERIAALLQQWLADGLLTGCDRWHHT